MSASQNPSFEALATLIADVLAIQQTLEAIQHTLGAVIITQNDLSDTVSKALSAQKTASERLTSCEVRLEGLNTAIMVLSEDIKAQKSGPSALDLANELADLRLTIEKMREVDRLSLSRHKIGRAMLAANMIGEDEFQFLAQGAPVNQE